MSDSFMLHQIVKKLKVLLSPKTKEKIKKITGFGLKSQKASTLARVVVDPRKVNIAIYTGGGLGDFIVYSALFDQMLAMCDCEISIFTLSYDNAVAILNNRKSINIYYPFRPVSRKKFDVVIEIDHYLHVRDYAPITLKRKSVVMYDLVNRIIRHNKDSIPVTKMINSQRLLLITRAKFLNLNRWTQLSGGGAFNMSAMRADVFKKHNSTILTDNSIHNCKYITIHYGTDPDAGGDRQTKLWPFENFRNFVKLFKIEFPSVRIVQLAASNEKEIPGVDICIRDASLDDVAVVLQSALTHVSSEGGIAHIATQVGTRCVILFGPTPVHYYGYPTNINIVSPVCNSCMEISVDWFTKCPRGLKNPECMHGISADMVLSAIKEII